MKTMAKRKNDKNTVNIPVQLSMLRALHDKDRRGSSLRRTILLATGTTSNPNPMMIGKVASTGHDGKVRSLRKNQAYLFLRIQSKLKNNG